jgi:hypothetical protein
VSHHLTSHSNCLPRVKGSGESKASSAVNPGARSPITYLLSQVGVRKLLEAEMSNWIKIQMFIGTVGFRKSGIELTVREY